MDFNESKESPAQNNGIRYLILSVFFALLSFFILLNFISSNNVEKADSLTKSVKKEFKDKKLNEEMVLFSPTKVKKADSAHEQGFRDVITNFLEQSKSTIDSELSETPENYMIRVKSISFFGPGSNSSRANASNFVLYLNKFVSAIRKTGGEQARLVMLYDPESTNNTKDVDEKIRNLHGIISAEKEKNILFSIAPVDTRSNIDRVKLDNIYILFAKNEF